MDRRQWLVAAGSFTVAGLARAQHPHHGIPSEQMAPLRGEGPVVLTPQQLAQRQTASPAPAGPPGAWRSRAPLPLPRTEMAWAAGWAGRMHIVGGYAEGKVDKPYHHVYDPGSDSWATAAALPKGANHVGVAADAGRVYAIGGFIEQNRMSHNGCYAYDIASDRWTEIAPLSRPRGAAAVVALNGLIHAIGGASDPSRERASVGWHEVYDPQKDNWSERRAMPTNRSGHGLVVLKDRFWAMGGESGRIEAGQLTGNVHGQMESYDPATDSWQHHAPMPTPRHGMGAVALGEWIHIAGGGPVVGGSILTSTHEAFHPG